MKTLITILEELRSCNDKGITIIESGTVEKFVPYAELHRKALAALFHLQQKGMKPGHELVMQVEDLETFITLFWGCIMGHIIPVPLTVGKQPDHKIKLLQVWKKLNNPTLVIEEKWLEKFTQFLQEENRLHECTGMLQSAMLASSIMQGTQAGEKAVVSGEDLAYIQFSSGSTGDPKGVCLTHDNLIANTSDIASRSRITEKDSMLSWMPLTHDMGIICFHLTGVLTGINQYIMLPDLFIRRPLLWIEKTNEHRVTLLYSPNFGLQYFLAALGPNDGTGWDLSPLRIIYNGAEPISPKICEEFTNRLKPCGLSAEAIFPGYGMAEASVAVSLPNPGDKLAVHYLQRESLKVGQAVEHLEEQDAERSAAFVEVGYAIETCRVRIAGSNDEVLEDGVLGNIQIRGNNVTKGYYNEPGKSKEVFTADGWLRTGDLGFMNKERLIITGRSKHIIIINGQNYYPHDIENVAITIGNGAFDRVVACGVRDRQTNVEELMLFVLYKRSQEEFVSVVKQLRAGITEIFGIPLKKVATIRKVPKTTSGKVQHYKLSEAYYQGEFDEQLQSIEASMETAMEAQLADAATTREKLGKIIAGLQGTNTLVSEDLQAAGFNSLKAMQLVSRIEQYFGKRISVKDIFEAGNIPALASLVDSRERTNDGTITADASLEHYPLTPQQHKFWVLEQLQPGNSACIITLSHGVKGHINVPALESACKMLAARHQSLRTIFFLDGSGPRQKVMDPADLQFAISSGADADILLHPFDLTAGPLFRLVLQRIGENEYNFLFAVHHIVADGWSMNVLFNELGAIYSSLLSGTTPMLKSLPLQYPQFALWNTDRLASGALEHDRAYWLSQLSGELPVPQFPFADNPKAALSYRGEAVRFEFNEEVSRSLDQLAKKEGVTLFTGLLSLVNLLLYKYSGQKDIILGTSTAGRTASMLENLVGLFINTLCIRTRLDPAAPFSRLLKEVQATLYSAIEHQAYPFELLPDDLQLARDMQRTPLFNVLVLFQNFIEAEPVQALDINWELKPLHIEKPHTLVELQFEFFHRNDIISCELTYDRAIFSRDNIMALVAHLQHLAAAVSNTSASLHMYSLLNNRERKQLASFNQPFIERGELTVCNLFEIRAGLIPNATAVICGHQRLSYAALNYQASQVAAFLVEECGTVAGDKIGLWVSRSEKMLVLMLGIMKAGAAFVPIDTDYPAERVQFMINDIGLQLLFSDDGPSEEFPGTRIITTGRLFRRLPQYAAAYEGPSAADLAYVLYTSGTTGRPKGVLVSHQSLADYVMNFSDHFSIHHNDVVLQQSSICFDTFVEEIFPALHTGATIVVLPEGGRDVQALIHTIVQEKVTVLSTTPGVLKELNQSEAGMKSLRLIISGGDFLAPNCIDKLPRRAQIYNTYGPTETVVCATYHRVTNASQASLIGKPVQNKRVYILNADLGLVPVGVTGEIFIAGKFLGNGYHGHPELTLARFLPDLFVENERMYRTGDLGKWLPDGSIQMLGRKDSQFKVNGYRIEPEEVEQALARCEGIADAVALVVQGRSGNNLLAAYYEANAAIDTQKLREQLSRLLPVYMVPSILAQIPFVPYTINGKKDRSIQLFPPPEEEKSTRPQSSLQSRLLAIWEDVLDRSDCSVTENFFESGGNSIKATRIAMRIQQEMGYRIEFRDILLNPTIEMLCSIMEQAKAASLPAINILPACLHYELSHAQKRLWMMDRYENGQVAYNMAWAFELNGKLDVSKLGQAFKALAERHESFRTSFPLVAGEPRQQIKSVEELDFAMEVVDLEQQGTEDKLHQLLQQEVHLPFDLEAGPLLKAVLYCIEQDRYILLLKMHHIIADGWSLSIFARELGIFYKAQEPAQALQPLRIQYKEYAAWHNKLLEDGLLRNDREYWLGQFSDDIPALNMPHDFARPSTKTFNGQTLRFAFKESNASFLQQYSEENGVSLFVVLLGMINTLFYRYTGQEDIVIGTAIAGREHPELQDQVGFYVNTLALRNKIFGEESMPSLISRINDNLMDAYKHQAYPFDLLVNDLGLKNDRSRSPLFDIMFMLQNNETAELELKGVEVTRRNLHKAGSKFDLIFDLIENGPSLQCEIEYNTDLFSKERVSRIFGAFEALVESVRENPGCMLDDLSLSPVTENVYEASPA
jgi:amino acid adenylation domain-containing protein